MGIKLMHEFGRSQSNFNQDTDLNVKLNRTNNELETGTQYPQTEFEGSILINQIHKKYGSELSQYLSLDMTQEELNLYVEAFNYDKYNAKRMKELHLTTAQMRQLVKGFKKKLDLAQEIKAGVSDEDFDLLLEAIDILPLEQLFTEDKQYIDYDGIREKLKVL